MKKGICKDYPEPERHEHREHELREHELGEGSEENNPFRKAKLPKIRESFWGGLNSKFS